MAALAVWAFAAPAHAKETLTIVADQWCPYNCAQEDAKQGYMVDIVRAALKKSDIDVVYKVMPWSQAIAKTRAGEYDALVGAARGDAPDFIFPEVLQGISINQFWVRKESLWNYNGEASLASVRIGVVEDYSYGKVMDAYLRARIQQKDTNIAVSNTQSATESNIEDVVEGKLDAIIEDKNAVEYYFASRGMQNPLRPASMPVNGRRYDDTFIYVAFAPNNPKANYYAGLLTRGVQAMRKNGELKAILAGYNVDEAYHFRSDKAAAQ